VKVLLPMDLKTAVVRVVAEVEAGLGPVETAPAQWQALQLKIRQPSR
jgi:hypothetical protein